MSEVPVQLLLNSLFYFLRATERLLELDPLLELREDEELPDEDDEDEDPDEPDEEYELALSTEAEGLLRLDLVM